MTVQDRIAAGGLGAVVAVLIFIGFIFWASGQPWFNKANRSVNITFTCETEGVICDEE